MTEKIETDRTHIEHVHASLILYSGKLPSGLVAEVAVHLANDPQTGAAVASLSLPEFRADWLTPGGPPSLAARQLDPENYEALAMLLRDAARYAVYWMEREGNVRFPIVCESCGRVTYDPDLWDPEADTGRILCDRCWNTEHRPGWQP